MNQDLLRIVDSIARDKNIEKDSLFNDIETALLSAAKKFYGETDDVTCTIDRMTGEIQVRKEGILIDYREFGRIAAQTAKQVLIQKIREDERGSIYEEFADRQGQIISGTVARSDGPVLSVNLGRCEGFLPRKEQIPGETHQVGERIRCLVLEVKDAGNQVKIVLSRSHPDFIRRLFELEVPEVQERIIEVRALAREAGYRTKIAVSSIDTKVDCVGACVGVRGSRIKNIVDELGGEKIDIVRWNESSQVLITNALKPAEVKEICLNFELNRATVVVDESQLSLAIGKRGQNVRLAARLTNWDIDILTPEEYSKGLDDLEKALRTIEGVDDKFMERLVTLGLINLLDLDEVGKEPLIKELELSEELAEKLVVTAREAAKRVQEEDAARKAAAATEAAAAAEAEQTTEGEESTEPAASAETAEVGSAKEVEATAPAADTAEAPRVAG
ncbi:MAG: transcription termination/antitermination protein NusA [Phycisphaerales bacterium]|nr:transcription termination/antitermination protein NusA [Phycisphaerales bacterium]